jgi:VCBS repeat-containing protein
MLKKNDENKILNKLILATFLALLGSLLSTLYISKADAADVVPNEIMMPGTQPNEVGNFESPDKCDNCHAGYNDLHPEYEPATGWRGAAMGNAGRDPVFWATLGIAEQDFDGSGDLCIRCHSAGGWYGGRSTPTDGSGLAASDDNGIDCDTCHTMTNPDNSEHQGVMNSPFIANCDPDSNVPNKCTTTGSAGDGFYGSGMTSLWSGSDKLGPYSDAAARHQFMQSQFHRSVDFCGSCHDVSNSAVGDLAPGNGAQPGAPHVVSSQDFNGGAPDLGGPIEDKAAFNNPPYAYGIVERTFSEYKASAFPTTLVSDFTSLPGDLQVAGGSLDTTYQAALLAGTGGNYEDGTERFFSCQSCHMRPVVGNGCNKNGAPLRSDLPMHDQTGGNYWFANMTQYQDNAGTLRLGGGLSGNQILAMDLGQQRAVKHLQQAGDLQLSNNTLKVVNLTGHKLITGYPEGRRMWLNIKWYDTNNVMIREDGAYGPIGATVANPAGGPDVAVESIIDLDDPNTKVYEAHYAMTKEWADTLLAVGKPASLPLSFDRITGDVDFTLGDLAALPAGSYHETFHFALNNKVVRDNRIPPYGMLYDVAKKRNALPVPENQYGSPDTGGVYNYWDEIDLNALKPAGAVFAEIDLLYQGTSWEYIQFLDRANTGQNAFLGEEGTNMLDAWINAEVPVAMEVGGDRKMVPPVVMKSVTWGTPPSGNVPPVAVDDSYSTAQDTALNISAPGVLANDSDTDNDPLTAVLVPNGTVGSVILNPDGSFSYTPPAGFTGDDHFTYQASDGTTLSALATVNITVTAVGGNNAPVANDDSYSTDQDTVLNVPAPGVLGNDTDADSDTLTAVQLSSAANGAAVLASDGSLIYTPNPGFTGSDSFTYAANDGTDQSAAATVNITVNSVGQMACSDYTVKGECNNDVNCEWSGNPKNGSCNDVAVCTPTESTEVSCNDGNDNDCDGAVDCSDSDCSGDPACQQADCTSFNDKNTCNAQATCSWSNKNRICQSI